MGSGEELSSARSMNMGCTHARKNDKPPDPMGRRLGGKTKNGLMFPVREHKSERYVASASMYK